MIGDCVRLCVCNVYAYWCVSMLSSNAHQGEHIVCNELMLLTFWIGFDECCALLYLTDARQMALLPVVLLCGVFCFGYLITSCATQMVRFPLSFDITLVSKLSFHFWNLCVLVCVCLCPCFQFSFANCCVSLDVINILGIFARFVVVVVVVRFSHSFAVYSSCTFLL